MIYVLIIENRYGNTVAAYSTEEAAKAGLLEYVTSNSEGTDIDSYFEDNEEEFYEIAPVEINQ